VDPVVWRRLMFDQALVPTVVELWIIVPIYPRPSLNKKLVVICNQKGNYQNDTLYDSILHLFMQQFLIILQTDGYTEGGRAR